MRRGRTLARARILPFLLAVACTDAVPTTAPIATSVDPGAGEFAPLGTLTCAADLTQRTVACAAPESAEAIGAQGTIIGGQDQYVTLTSSNVQVVADTFAFDVQVENLLPQPIGTSNGISGAAAGIRVFFSAGPTSTSGGTITVANADGVGAFTGSSQAYFQYDALLVQHDVSPVKRWKLQFSPEVTNFVFTVYVSADVQYPDGYIDNVPYVLALDPGETRTISGMVRNVVGEAKPGEAITWTSSDPSIAAVTGTQVTAGGARGITTLTATTSTARPAIHPTIVSICQSTVVTNGTNLPSSIETSDCRSSFGSNSGLPSNSYYADLYRVALTAGQTVTITMDSGDDLDTYLLLATGDIGDIVAGNDDDDEQILGVGSRIIYTATRSGTYVIEASTFNGLDTGSYTLQVTIN